MTTAEALAALVRAEIDHAGLSQAEVCRTVGITPKHLCQFLLGHAGMSLDLVDEVLAACDRRLVLTTVPSDPPTPPLVELGEASGGRVQEAGPGRRATSQG